MPDTFPDTFPGEMYASMHFPIHFRAKCSDDLGPLANRDLRRITGFDRKQVMRLLQTLRDAGKVRIVGRGRGAGYVYRGGS